MRALHSPYCYPHFVDYAEAGIIFPFKRKVKILREDIQILIVFKL